MSESGWARLRRSFIEDYERLRRQLAGQLGSADAARDVLQDTFLQLSGEDRDGEEIRDPRQYLNRIVFNLASSRRRTERRRASIAEMVDLANGLEIADPTPGPVEIAEQRSDIERLREALEEMPARQKEMVLAVLLEGATTRDLAERYGLSMRMIQIEMRKITDQLSERFGGAEILHFAPRRDVTSDS